MHKKQRLTESNQNRISNSHSKRSTRSLNLIHARRQRRRISITFAALLFAALALSTSVRSASAQTSTERSVTIPESTLTKCEQAADELSATKKLVAAQSSELAAANTALAAQTKLAESKSAESEAWHQAYLSQQKAAEALQQAKDSESKRADAEHATAVTWQAKAEDYRKQNKSLRKKLAVSVLLNIAEGVGLAFGF
jgi:hypothetical protein